MRFKETEIGKIPFDWEVVTIENALEEIIDYRGKTPAKSETGIVTLSAKSVKNGYIDYSKAYYISELIYQKFMVRGFPQKGDILLTTEAPLGLVAKLNREKVAIAQRLLTLRGKKEYLSNDYLMYYFMSDEGQHQLKSRQSGTTVTGIKQKEFRKCLISIPPFEEQKAIAHILSTLDEKIEVNNQINKTLENIAQTIFKQWFVDFEFPNGEKEPYKSSGGEMVESELGMIPKGWEVVELATIINVKHGYAFKSDYFSDIPTNKVLLTPRNFRIGGGVKDDKLKYYDEKVEYPSDYVLNEEDILITMTDLSKDGDTLGYPIMLPKRKYAMLHNQRLGKIEIKNNLVPAEYLYYLFCTREYRGYILGSATGTTVKHTAPKRILAYKIALPKYNVLKDYGNAISNIMKLFSDISYQNGVLLKVRDSLLPKLMSGEIRVPIEEN